MNGPASPGLQPERTALAWRRTTLALIGLSLGSARLTWHVLGPAALTFAVAGVSLGVWLTVHEQKRYVRHSTSLRAGTGVGEGVAPLLTAALTVAIAAAGLVAVLTAH